MTWPRVARSALVTTVVVLLGSGLAQIWSAPSSYETGGRPLNSLLLVALTLPLLVARRRPLPVLLLVLGAVAADNLLGGELGQSWFAIVLAVYALGAYGSVWGSGIGLAALTALVLAVDIPRLQQGDPVDEVLPAWFFLAGTWALGAWIRHRHRELAELASTAAALEHDRDEAARAAVAYERARIAHELHDLVAHALAVIVLQAQAADRVLAADVEAARTALAAIESTGRDGLAELRRLLDIVLVDLDTDELEPRPSLQHLDLLVERVRRAGLPVALAVSGTSRPLPPGVDLSAYRIVQEALTNTLKHAGRTEVSVDVVYSPGELGIRVEDRGTAGPGRTDGAGHGLVGMRERARLYGGTVQAGPRPGGGFLVEASLPTGAVP